MTESTSDPYLLRGLAWCRRHNRLMVPARRLDSTRVYACQPDQRTHDVLAAPLEADLLLKALIRATITLCPNLGYSINLSDPDSSSVAGGRSALAADAEAVRLWHRCRLSDRRQVILTAYTRVDIDTDGQVRPAWRCHANSRSWPETVGAV